MKELSIEEKAKRYDEALEKARQLCAYPTTKPFISDLQDLFPELAESEDEKIRKAIIYGMETLKDQRKNTFNTIPIDFCINWLKKQGQSKKTPIWKHWKNGIAGNGEGKLTFLIKSGVTYNLSSCLSFECDYIELSELENLMLEKQGEQKSVNDTDEDIVEVIKNTSILDMVEPKFKVGDFIVNDYCKGKIIELTDDAYLLDTGQGIPFSCEHNIHLWTIEDAKDGDVLATKDNRICIFDNTVEEGKYPFAYCGLSIYGFEVYDRTLPFAHFDVYPATKEQRDLLFQRMKEAGYEWDADKKELKKL